MALFEPTVFAGKRRRTDFTESRHTRRPIDKSLKAINKAGVDATDVTTVLLTTTFPCTIVGLRWDLTIFQDAGTGTAQFWWALVINRDGNTVGTLGVSDAAQFFEPEQNCLVFGVGSVDNNVEAVPFRGSTKTMRKMMGGDRLQFIMRGAATNTSACNGVVQFFCKS